MSGHQQRECAPQAVTEAPLRSVSLGEELDHEPPVMVPESFVIDHAQKASWAVRKVVEAREYAKRVQQWCERELRRAEQEEAWLLRRFGMELKAWAAAELERRGGRRKSLELPGGTLGFRRQAARVEIINEQAVITWSRSHFPIALKITVEANDAQGVQLLRWHEEHGRDSRLQQRILRDPLNRHFAETGEVPEGAGVRPAADEFYVR
jgi:hypothetical protein